MELPQALAIGRGRPPGTGKAKSFRIYDKGGKTCHIEGAIPGYSDDAHWAAGPLLDLTILLPVTPPPAPVVQLPGHGDYPRFPKKPVRPVWDRKSGSWQAPSDVKPEDAQPEPAPLVKAKAKPELKPGDADGLARLITPKILKTEQPRQLVERKAQASLAESDDTIAGTAAVDIAAYAHVIDVDLAAAVGSVDIDGMALLPDADDVLVDVVARCAVTEADDTLTASASWDDDELALTLLLGE